MATDELSKKLNRRNEINEGGEASELPSMNVWNPYTEFKEFSRKQIQDFQKTFNKWVIEMQKICHVFLFFKLIFFVFYGVWGQSLLELMTGFPDHTTHATLPYNLKLNMCTLT